MIAEALGLIRRQERQRMRITIDLPRDLEQDLLRQAERENVPLAILIIQALRRSTRNTPNPAPAWPDVVLSYEGIEDFPAFESYRDELLPPREPELF